VLVAAKLESEGLAKLQQSGPFGDAAGKLHELVTEALNKARMVVNELVTPLLYVVGFTAAMRQLSGQMEKRHGLRIALDVQDLPDLLPEAVKTQLFHSVRELLLNVVKHSGADSASASVRRTDGRIDISVSDSGRGFDAEAVLSGNGPHACGYGLFSISERMVAMGGRMSIESRPGNGTRVTLSVPAVAEAGQKPESPPRHFANAGRQAAGRFGVLVVDDHAVVRCGIVAMLSHEAALAVVGEAANGRDALELTRKLRPGVVVMDVRMPDMDGIEATRLILAEFPDTVVIGMSAFCDEGFRTAMLDAGASVLLDKAHAGANLVPTICNYLAMKKKADHCTTTMR